MKSKWKSFFKYPLGYFQGRELLLTNTAKSFWFSYQHNMHMVELNLKWKLFPIENNTEDIKMAGIYLRAYKKIQTLLKNDKNNL